MNVTFRITNSLLGRVVADLERRHEFAFERVGFLFCRFGRIDATAIMVLGYDYMPVMDEEYIEDHSFGALIGGTAFRRALERTLYDSVGIFHIHMHAHKGQPAPSRTDERESGLFVPDFFHIRANLPHGTLILSEDALCGRVWLSPTLDPIPISGACVVGSPLRFLRGLS